MKRVFTVIANQYGKDSDVSKNIYLDAQGQIYVRVDAYREINQMRAGFARAATGDDMAAKIKNAYEDAFQAAEDHTPLLSQGALKPILD
ncbi:MAG: hypothetical protein LRZ85_07210 [Alphaproteobacteria bacterium]|nr:hypothetical protein [Alphaproteobacteria bacterium]